MLLNILLTVAILIGFLVIIAIRGENAAVTGFIAFVFVILFVVKLAAEQWLLLFTYTNGYLVFSLIVALVLGFAATVAALTDDFPIYAIVATVGIIFVLLGYCFIDGMKNQAKYDALVIKEADVASMNFNEKEVYKVDRDFALNKIKKSFSEVPNHAYYEIKSLNLMRVKDELQYVAELGHVGYFKWDKEKIIPGYFTLSATDMDAKVKFVAAPYMYSEQAYFGKYASRVLYKKVKEEKLGSIHFELDDEGVPHYVQAIQKNVNTVSGQQATGAALINLQTGKVNVYSLKKVPTWVDDAIGAEQAAYMAEIRGEYPKGSFNFSNEGKTTPNLNGEEAGMKPVFINGKEYYFVEFSTYGNDGNSMDDALLIDARTGVASKLDFGEPLMDSDGAMVIGEKKYVEKKWHGVNPMLYNIEGIPTWVYSLLDSSDYHQRFVFVNAANHVITADDANLEKALTFYKEALAKGVSAVDVADGKKLPEKEKDITIKTLNSITTEEGYVCYILTTTGEKFSYATNHVEDFIFYDQGDTIKVSYKETGDIQTIIRIVD